MKTEKAWGFSSRSGGISRPPGRALGGEGGNDWLLSDAMQTKKPKARQKQAEPSPVWPKLHLPQRAKAESVGGRDKSVTQATDQTPSAGLRHPSFNHCRI